MALRASSRRFRSAWPARSGCWSAGALGDRLRMKMANGRLLVAAVAMLCAAPCIYIALEQPKGSVTVFTI
jgi:hypothetical protein